MIQCRMRGTTIFEGVNHRARVCPLASTFARYDGAIRMTIMTYRGFYIVKRNSGKVDIVNPHNERWRVAKSVFAAKWRIGRANNLATKIRGLV